MTPEEIAEIEERHGEGYPLVEYLIHQDIDSLLAHVKAQDAEIEQLRAQVAAVEQESIRSAAYALNEYFGDSSLASTLWLLARADEIAYRAALSGASDEPPLACGGDCAHHTHTLSGASDD